MEGIKQGIAKLRQIFRTRLSARAIRSRNSLVGFKMVQGTTQDKKSGRIFLLNLTDGCTRDRTMLFLQCQGYSVRLCNLFRRESRLLSRLTKESWHGNVSDATKCPPIPILTTLEPWNPYAHSPDE